MKNRYSKFIAYSSRALTAIAALGIVAPVWADKIPTEHLAHSHVDRLHPSLLPAPVPPPGPGEHPLAALDGGGADAGGSSAWNGSVPEPGTGLLLLAGASWWMRRRRR